MRAAAGPVQEKRKKEVLLLTGRNRKKGNSLECHGGCD